MLLERGVQFLVVIIATTKPEPQAEILQPFPKRLLVEHQEPPIKVVMEAPAEAHTIGVKNVATPEVAMVATATVQMQVLAKAPLLVNLEKPMGTYMPAVAVGITQSHLVPVAPEVAVITRKMAKQIPAVAAVLAVRAALASLSSASIRRWQHEIRDRSW